MDTDNVIIFNVDNPSKSYFFKDFDYLKLEKFVKENISTLLVDSHTILKLKDYKVDINHYESTNKIQSNHELDSDVAEMKPYFIATLENNPIFCFTDSTDQFINFKKSVESNYRYFNINLSAKKISDYYKTHTFINFRLKIIINPEPDINLNFKLSSLIKNLNKIDNIKLKDNFVILDSKIFKSVFNITNIDKNIKDMKSNKKDGFLTKQGYVLTDDENTLEDTILDNDINYYKKNFYFLKQFPITVFYKYYPETEEFFIFIFDDSNDLLFFEKDFIKGIDDLTRMLGKTDNLNSQFKINSKNSTIIRNYVFKQFIEISINKTKKLKNNF